MNIVPLIKDGSIVKSHTEYPITNNQWKLMNNGLGLWDYLDTLQLAPINVTTQFSRCGTARFAGINTFYLRERYDNYGGFITHDPWNRQFVVMPLDKRTHTSMYQYYCYGSINLNLNVDVIVTTVNKSRVYCVDLIRETV
jgi:hypothetical protein